MRLACVVLVLASALPARAFDDPDTEVARRHFEKGRVAYDAQDYRRALDEFLAAKRAKAAPALDYNIARCYDRLEDYPQAIKHYEAYYSSKPSASDQNEVQERIRTLKQRLDEQAAAHPTRTTTPTRPIKEEPLLIKPPSFDDVNIGITPPPPIVIVNKPWDEAAARRRRNIGIAVGVTAGLVVIGGAIALGVLLGSPSAPAHFKSELDPRQVTP